MGLDFSWIRKIIDESRSMNASVYKISSNGLEEKCFTYSRNLRPTPIGFTIEGKYFDLKNQLSCQINLAISNNGDLQYQESHPGLQETSSITFSNSQAVFKNSKSEKIIQLRRPTWVLANLPYAVMQQISKGLKTQKLHLDFADALTQQVHEIPISISTIDPQHNSAKYPESNGDTGELLFLNATNQLLQWKGIMRPQLHQSGQWQNFYGIMKFGV